MRETIQIDRTVKDYKLKIKGKFLYVKEKLKIFFNVVSSIIRFQMKQFIIAFFIYLFLRPISRVAFY